MIVKEDKEFQPTRIKDPSPKTMLKITSGL